MKMIRGMCIALLAGLIITSTAAASIVLSWAPPAFVPCAVGGTVDIGLYADIPEADAVIGFGLDLYMDTAVAIPTAFVAGPDFSEVYAATPDPDNAGVAWNFAAIGVYPPAGVFGHVLLGTFTFEGVANGATVLALGAHVNDLNEGFAPPFGPFIPFTAIEGGIIVPEPTTLVLLGLGILGLIRRR